MRKTYGHEAAREALDVSMDEHPEAIAIGQGVPDASQTYGTTGGLLEKYGPKRVLDMPLSEASMVGTMLGASITGLRPVMTFARLEFAMLAIDQLVNQSAKWHYMFNGAVNVPLTLRMIVGRGWGQGAQHSQSLHSWFAHIPGLKVVMPSTPYDLKGLLISSINDPNPVVFIEHRWIHYNFGHVPEGYYTIPLDEPNLVRQGDDATIVASSYMTVEAIKASGILEKENIHVDLIDLRTVSPLKDDKIIESVRKTGRLIVCDHASYSCGLAGEIISRVCEKALTSLKHEPIRITLPDLPAPTTRALANYYYPTTQHIVNSVKKSLGLDTVDPFDSIKSSDFYDIADASFKGPF